MARCQFKTLQCADMATDLLARALKAAANAVMNPKVSAETLKALSNTLIKYSTDPRTKYNASELPSLGGAPQAMGSCAWTTEAEYNPTTGQRYDQAREPIRHRHRRARHRGVLQCTVREEVLQIHQARGWSGEEHHGRFRRASVRAARRVGRLIHDVLSADLQLGANVVGWEHRGEPSPAFVAALACFDRTGARASTCTGNRAFPSTGTTTRVSNAHMVAVLGASGEDPGARALQSAPSGKVLLSHDDALREDVFLQMIAIRRKVAARGSTRCCILRPID